MPSCDHPQTNKVCEGYVFTPVPGGCPAPGPGDIQAQARGVYPSMHCGRHPPPSPRQTATAADGTHPTGMHSCLYLLLQTYMEDGVCRSGNLLKGAIIERLFYAYAISAFLSYYAVPCAAFFFFYGSVALKMRRRQNNSKFESNKSVTIHY